jgi:glycosyltransferase involved in cell wall biosynthesis
MLAATDGQTSPGDAVLMLVRPRPSSISYRPLLDVVGGRPLLEWCVERLSVVTAESGHPIIGVVSRDEASIYEPIFASLGAPITTVDERSEVRAISTAMANQGLAHATIVRPETAFVPTAYLKHFLAIGDSARDFVLSEGLPQNIAPLMVKGDALTSVLPFLGVISVALRMHINWALRPALDIVERLNHAGADETSPLSFQHVEPPRDGEAVSLSPLEIESPDDVAIATTVLELGEPFIKRWAVLRRESARSSFVRPGHASRTPSPTKRILYVTNASSFTGGHEALCQLIAHLNRQEFTPFALIGSEGHFAERLRVAGCEVAVAPRSLGASTREVFDYILASYQAIQPDIVHISDFSGMSAFHAASSLHIPTLFHVRVPGAHLLRDALDAADHILAVSEHVRADVMMNGVDAADVTTVHSGIDTVRYAPGNGEARRAGRRMFDAADEDRLVVMVGRFHPVKRHDVFIHAIRALLERHRNIRGLIVGESDFAMDSLSYVKGLLDKLDVAKAIRLAGFQSDMTKIYAAADVAVLCSDAEPLGLSALEAMSSKTPTVISTNGGLPPLVAGTNAAIVVPPGNSLALASAIESILVDAELAAQLREGGRDFVISRFDSRKTHVAVTSVYKSIIERSEINQQAAGSVKSGN